MPTKINVMFDHFNIQTWKMFLVSFKMHTWLTEGKKHTNTNKTNKYRMKKYTQKNKIFMKVK